MRTTQKGKTAHKLREEMARKFKKGNIKVDIGFFGEQHDEGDITMAGLARIHNEGTADGRIPSSNFMETAFKRTGNVVPNLIKQFNTAEPNKAMQTFNKIGVRGVADIKNVITEQDGFQPLAESTLKIKGANKSKRMIDTGQFLNSPQFTITQK